MKITHCDYCNKKLKDVDVTYQIFAQHKFELCEKCYKEFKKLKNEYQERIKEKLNELRWEHERNRH